MAIRAAWRAQHASADSSFPVSHFPFSLSERELARLWRDQTFPREALVTGDRERLRVIYRGRCEGGPGPDFRGALIAARGSLLEGDVELHVRSSDFQRHGHQRDPAYGSVVLHVVFWDDERRPTVLPGGATAPVVALVDWVDGRANEIAQWLERPVLWREPCFSAIRRQGASAVAATLDRLGAMRFRRKAAAFVPIIGREGAEEALWQGLLEALAFGPDQDSFRLLAQQVSWVRLRARLCSLAPAERESEALRLLEAAFARVGPPASAPRRPANRPAFRLRGAARLAARFAQKGLAEHVVDVFEESKRGRDQGSPAQVKAARLKGKSAGPRGEAAERLLVSSFAFPSPKRKDPEKAFAATLISALTVPALVGRSRAIEIIANAVLPWLAAVGPEQRGHAAEAVFASLPLPAPYGSVRHLHEAVGGASGGQPSAGNRKSKSEADSGRFRVSSFQIGSGSGAQGVRIDFRRQQGMLYLLNQYCTQGGCGRCPLS